MHEPFSKKMSEAAPPASGAGGANQPFFCIIFLNFGGGDFSFNVFEKGLVCYCLAKAIQAGPRSAKPSRALERPKPLFCQS